MYSHQLVQSSCEGRDFIVCYITIDPGGSIGWHWHDSTLVGAIKQGELTHYAANCSVDGDSTTHVIRSRNPQGPSTCTSAGNLWPHTG